MIPTTGARAQDQAAWRLLPPAPIEARAFHTAIWTQEEMIVWGGSSTDRLFADGAAYNPETDQWRKLPPAPLRPRTGHTAVWTGREMIIWGGCCERHGDEFGDGAAYDPETNSWRLLSPAPIHGRTGHTAVRGGGREMVVWGGHVFEEAFSDGAVYDPTRDRWKLLPPAPMEGRYSHTAVAIGVRMMIWGGATIAPEILGDGGSFNAPIPNEWVPIEATRPGRTSHTAVLTWHAESPEMIVWGGCCTEEGLELGGGSAYDIESGQWRRLAPAHLRPRQGHTATWTGRRMVIWGGVQGLESAAEGFADGAAYDPEKDRWMPLPESPLAGRYAHSAVLTPDEIIVWGGCCSTPGEGFGDGASLDLARAGVPDLASSQGIPIEGDGFCAICGMFWALGLSFGLPILALVIWSFRKRRAERDG